jgi:D-xylose transport system substrate-binding protein
VSVRKPIIAALCAAVFSFASFAQPIVGISLSDVFSARWPRERDAMIALLEKGGCRTFATEAHHDSRLQADQMREMALKGAKILIVVAEDGESLAPLADDLAAQGVEVIAYDRLIPTASVAAYVSFDFFEIGRMQARGILAALGDGKVGRVALLGGSPTDTQAHRLRIGQMEVLKPCIDRGDLRIVADQWVENWDPANAAKAMKWIIEQTKGSFDAVIASNDGTALGALESLRAAGLAGKVPISGMDATRDACKAVARGELSLTVYKDLSIMPQAACDIAFRLSRGEGVPETAPYSLSDFMLDDSFRGSFPSRFLPPILINKDTLKSSIVDSGYRGYDEVYADVENPPPR